MNLKSNFTYLIERLIMYVVNYDIAKNLSNYIKIHPSKFNDYTSKLVNKFICNLELDLPEDHIKKLSIVYQFICMYSLITRDLSIVKQIMPNYKIASAIIRALINNNIKLNESPQLVNIIIKFGKKHHLTLSSPKSIILACLYFDTNAFYDAIESFNDIYCNEIE